MYLQKSVVIQPKTSRTLLQISTAAVQRQAPPSKTGRRRAFERTARNFATESVPTGGGDEMDLTCISFLSKFHELSQMSANVWRFWKIPHKFVKFWGNYIRIGAKIYEFHSKIANFYEKTPSMVPKMFDQNVALNVWVWSGAKACKSCRSRKMI